MGKKNGGFQLKSKNEMEKSNYGISGTKKLMALHQYQVWIQHIEYLIDISHIMGVVCGSTTIAVYSVLYEVNKFGIRSICKSR